LVGFEPRSGTEPPELGRYCREASAAIAATVGHVGVDAEVLPARGEGSPFGKRLNESVRVCRPLLELVGDEITEHEEIIFVAEKLSLHDRSR
jgi:hypothetical protein